MLEKSRTAAELRRLWLPQKSRLNSLRSSHPTAIRFHRACSWLEESERLDPEKQIEGVLLYQWIAFNALYGQWDDNLHEPVSDRTCWQVFLARILELDQGGLLETLLLKHKALILKIFSNKHLNRYFWHAPEVSDAVSPQKLSRRAQSLYEDQAWYGILEQVMERIYLLRCQLVHGAATVGSRLNRASLKNCNTLMRLLMSAILEIWIEHGGDEDWGLLCYPPVARRPGT